MLIIIFIVMVIALFFLSFKYTEELRRFFIKHINLVKAILFGYIVLSGCCSFPISSEKFPLDFFHLYLLIVGYGFIGYSFAELYGAKKVKLVYLFTLLFTAFGMVCRYLLEFGEVSNTYNFTLINIFSYIVIIPLFVVAVYYFRLKTMIKQKKNG